MLWVVCSFLYSPKLSLKTLGLLVKLGPIWELLGPSSAKTEDGIKSQDGNSTMEIREDHTAWEITPQVTLDSPPQSNFAGLLFCALQGSCFACFIAWFKTCTIAVTCLHCRHFLFPLIAHLPGQDMSGATLTHLCCCPDTFWFSLEHLQWCSVCDPTKIFLKSKLYSSIPKPFSNFTHKTEIGTANWWRTTNCNPYRPITLSSESQIGSSP
jgi:hypothetical protein